MPREGEGCYFAPSSEKDLNSLKYLKLKNLLGHEYFQDSLPVPGHPDVQIEEIGEEGEKDEEEEEEVVDIDIDPNNINDTEVEVIKALYDDKEYEEIDDDFIQQANLDEVLELYDEKNPEPEEEIKKVSRSELEEAMNEFVSEHEVMFYDKNQKILEFEGIPYEQDHVLHAMLERSSESSVDPRESSESESEDDVISNASHFTNTDNRPEVISVRLQPIVRKEKKKKKVEKEEVKKESGKREKNETKEEKKERKEKIKADKKLLREEKKKRKVENKEEKNKVAGRAVGTYDIRQGTSVIKLS